MFVHPILHRAYIHLEEPQSTERIMILFAFLVLLTHSLWLAEMLSVKQVNQNLQASDRQAAVYQDARLLV